MGIPLINQGTHDQAIQVFDMRKLRRYRMPTWTGTGGGYARKLHQRQRLMADTPTEEWDIGTAFSGVGRPGYIEEMRHWARTLLAGKQPEPSHEDAMRVLKAISDSVESGKVVSLS